MNKINYTFIVCCYNQQDWVLENLESIRYQIEHYAGNRNMQLVIADDGSTDKTQINISKWIDIYEKLFCDVELILREKNIGTSKNVADAIRYAKGMHIIVLAGDDLINNTNIFLIIDKCKKNDVIANPPLLFNEKGINTNEKRYMYSVGMLLYSPKKIRRISKYECPVFNGGYVGNDFYQEDILRFSERVILLEDQARYMRAFEIVSKFNYKTSKIPFFLRRESELQVTTNKGKLHEIIVEDKKKLCQYALAKEKNLFLRNAIRMSYFQVRYPCLYKHFLAIFNLSHVLERVFRLIHNRKILQLSRDLIKYGMEKDVNAYIEEIRNNTFSFKKEFLNEN